MKPLLRAELLKLRTTRTFIALVASALLLSLLVVVLTTLLTNNLDGEDRRNVFLGDFTGLFILLLGVMGMAGEWRHHTITSTVLAAPDRLRLLTAKTVSYALVGALVSLFVMLSIGAVGSVILTSRGEEVIALGDWADLLWRTMFIAACFGALGVCIGALVRNQVVAVVGLLALTFMVEPTLLGLVPDVGRWGPTSGAPNGLLETAYGDEELLAPAEALVVELAWVFTMFAAAAAVLRRRDLT